MPNQDLYLSPDHAIFAEGVFIPVKYLINGSTIDQMDVASVTYFHIELQNHAPLYSAGLPTESYLDTGDRNSFANATDAIVLHPAFGSERGDVNLIWEARAYAPLRVMGTEVSRVRAQLTSLAPQKVLAPADNRALAQVD